MIVARTFFCLRETARLWRRRWVTLLLATLLAASALVLPLAAATIGFNLAPGLSRIALAPEITVFAALSAGPQDVATLRHALQQRPRVAQVRLLARDEALAELARRTGGGAALAQLKPNPLPDALIVVLAQDIDPDALDRSAAEMAKLPGVDSVLVDSGWYRKLAGAARVALRVAAVGGAIAILLVALAIAGTVRMVATAETDELRLFRLIGAEDWLIARPYAWTGGAVLLAAFSLSLGAVTALIEVLGPDFAWLAQMLGAPIGIEMPPSALLAGAAIAAFFAGCAGGALGVRTALRRVA